MSGLFGEIQIPRAVYNEVVTQGIARGAPDALTVRLFLNRELWPIIDVDAALLAAYTPSVILDPGETETLALALSLADPLVLLDDEIARSEARRLNLRLYGTLGVLVQAHHKQLLSSKQAELLIQEIANRPDIWISARLCAKVLDIPLKSGS